MFSLGVLVVLVLDFGNLDGVDAGPDAEAELGNHNTSDSSKVIAGFVGIGSAERFQADPEKRIGIHIALHSICYSSEGYNLPWNFRPLRRELNSDMGR